MSEGLDFLKEEIRATEAKILDLRHKEQQLRHELLYITRELEMMQHRLETLSDREASIIQPFERELAKLREVAAGCIKMELRGTPCMRRGQAASIPIASEDMKDICDMIIHRSRAVCIGMGTCVDYAYFVSIYLTSNSGQIETFSPSTIVAESKVPTCHIPKTIAVPDDDEQRLFSILRQYYERLERAMHGRNI